VAARRCHRLREISPRTKDRHETIASNQIMKKVMIAEDDKNIAAALEIRLKAAGYEVQMVPDGFRCYSRAVTHMPDLILMDIFMPIGSGLEVAQELERAGLADIPIIFMTASKEKNLKEKAKTLGAVGFFEKPFDPEKLLASIARNIGRDSEEQARS
jgi:CheY-like chemotaxis protein